MKRETYHGDESRRGRWVIAGLTVIFWAPVVIPDRQISQYMTHMLLDDCAMVDQAQAQSSDTRICLERERGPGSQSSSWKHKALSCCFRLWYSLRCKVLQLRGFEAAGLLSCFDQVDRSVPLLPVSEYTVYAQIVFQYDFYQLLICVFSNVL